MRVCMSTNTDTDLIIYIYMHACMYGMCCLNEIIMLMLMFLVSVGNRLSRSSSSGYNSIGTYCTYVKYER